MPENNPQRKPFLGEEGKSLLSPLVEKVGVPLLWFGIGYLAATLMQKPKRVA